MKYMIIRVTIAEGTCLHGAWIYYSDDELDFKLNHNISYEHGMRVLRKLEKLLGKTASLTINPYDPTIAYKELSGYIDRE